MDEKEKEIQKMWSEENIRDFIRRMLLYYDPYGLTIMGAPDDEYDSYVPKIFSFLLESMDQKFLEKRIYDLFQDVEVDDANRRRKTKQMAEDLVDLLRTEK